jgi:hypothetical protein
MDYRSLAVALLALALSLPAEAHAMAAGVLIGAEAIADIEFDPAGGRVEQVVVSTGQGSTAQPARSSLATPLGHIL